MSKYTQHYNGELTLEFVEDLHLYLLGSKQVYGVTNVLNVINKPQLNSWKMRQAMEFVKENIVEHDWTDEAALDSALKDAANASKKISGEAADLGTRIHEQLEHYINSQITGDEWNPIYAEEGEEVGVTSFLKWTEKHDIEWLASEKKALSKQHYYAGTFDGLAIVDGVNSIIDFKCVKKLYRPYLLQTSAYAKAVEEEFGIPIDHLYILKIPKEKKVRLPRVSVMEAMNEEIDELFEVFLAALKLKKWADEFNL